MLPPVGDKDVGEKVVGKEEAEEMRGMLRLRRVRGRGKGRRNGKNIGFCCRRGV
jgi:hypothetical protein